MLLEHQMLALMTVFYLFAWLPSSLGKYQSFGGKWLASNRNPIPGKELPQWGARVERAYSNLKDYYPAFVATIFLIALSGKSDTSTGYAAVGYVSGRVGHFISYGFGNVTMRFVFYVIAMFCNVFLLAKIFI